MMMTLSDGHRRGLIPGVFALLFFPGLLYPGVCPGAPAGSQLLSPSLSIRIAALLGKAERALAEDRLTVPSGRNAVGYAQEVLDLEPGNPEAQRILRAVVARYGLIAGAALDRAEALRRQELARAETYRSRGEKVVRRFKLSAAPLSSVAERLDAEGARTARASREARERHPVARRIALRMVGEYLHKSAVALDGGRVAEARRYFDLAAQIARDHGASSPALPGLDLRGIDLPGMDRRIAAAERDRAQAIGARPDAGSAPPPVRGGFVKAVFLPPSF